MIYYGLNDYNIVGLFCQKIRLTANRRLTFRNGESSMPTCPICEQSFTTSPAHCPICGCPIQKLQAISQQTLNPTTIIKAIDFYQTKIPAGAWFELKKIGYKYYLYGRLRVGAIKKSQYIGRV